MSTTPEPADKPPSISEDNDRGEGSGLRTGQRPGLRPSRADGPPSITHNDLYDAFEAGYMEGWQYNGGEIGYIRGAFEDWLRSRLSISERHQLHYRNCNCLADSGECCVPTCPCHNNQPTDMEET